MSSNRTTVSYLSMTAETLRDAMEEKGVWLQHDSSGQGHAWRDVDDDDSVEYFGEVLVSLADQDGNLVVGAEAIVGGEHYRIRKCKFE